MTPTSTALPAASAHSLASVPHPPLGSPPAAAQSAQHRQYELPHHLTAAAVARRKARPDLSAWGLDEDTAYDALLVLTELVTNAVEHALPPVALHLWTITTADGHTGLHIDVTDGGPAPEDSPWATSYTADEHGRGRHIITSLASHTSTHHTDTTHHSATLALP
ncbi:ATP-binding protein [Streptomyces coffeae]|uniref:ATP-binding protein n=1 Tax=Streptomyces coffeae TaxID=621382 RepID=A0ABS1NPV8_9ACTN|nr:ATP-binding protein [Streptomyces coffeae]MBL1102000.1 ATP-binding protein [Streptomyces coffeae]